jgi:hypothetical protein
MPGKRRLIALAILKEKGQQSIATKISVAMIVGLDVRNGAAGG